MTDPDSVKHETALDTGAEQLGKTYAQALIGAAEKTGVSDKVVSQLTTVVDEYLGGSPELAAAFASPRISTEEKIRVIDKVFGGEVDPLLLNFMKVMAGRDRLGFLSAVRDAADKIFDELSGRVLATVSTAVPLSDDLRGKITSQLGSALSRDVRLKELVEPDLIGGMVIRVGDTVFDGSVANRMDGLAREGSGRIFSCLAQSF